MPIMNGVELCKKILTVNSTQKIIIFSAHNEAEYFTEFMDIGISRFLLKPLNIANILETLYKVCLELDTEQEV